MCYLWSSYSLNHTFWETKAINKSPASSHRITSLRINLDKQTDGEQTNPHSHKINFFPLAHSKKPGLEGSFNSVYNKPDFVVTLEKGSLI